ncbi:hypothetical protein SUGI_1072890 [Cryptomeria japonica]|uniref:glucose-6-phosphate/phosphate translocator 1, chloroplastic n=1 Tax=Cryptomeria japonica TaxID=3369 RepID=UPI0024146BAD|nr:glucose-6-phosphate/phosphate translocator 1, chloroplastic [Cryptomeria japonica]GLJ50353.1 hypothetical protein SUGI_1072890 [Cryptomeria japonica]
MQMQAKWPRVARASTHYPAALYRSNRASFSSSSFSPSSFSLSLKRQRDGVPLIGRLNEKISPVWRSGKGSGLFKSGVGGGIGIGAPVDDCEEISVNRKLKIGLYFGTWWALGVAFNIYNKKVLNVFPFPLLTSTLSLVAGSLIMLFSWATRIADFPHTDADFWIGLAPVAVAHGIGQVGTTVCMSKNDVSFTHVIKSAEPAFSVVFSQLFMGETGFSLPLYMSLLPIIGGCSLAAATQLNFNMIGFVGAMISNMAFVMRNNLAKKTMKGKGVSGMNYYACLTIFSLVLLIPFAYIVEGPHKWIQGWQTALQTVSPNQLLWWVVAQSVFYHLYNQVSYMSLDEISPLTFSIGNTMKRVAIIASSIIIFQTPVKPLNALGASIAILGTFFYSQLRS